MDIDYNLYIYFCKIKLLIYKFLIYTKIMKIYLFFFNIFINIKIKEKKKECIENDWGWYIFIDK